jgi:hypothetical protein
MPVHGGHPHGADVDAFDVPRTQPARRDRSAVMWGGPRRSSRSPSRVDHGQISTLLAPQASMRACAIRAPARDCSARCREMPGSLARRAGPASASRETDVRSWGSASRRPARGALPWAAAPGRFLRWPAAQAQPVHGLDGCLLALGEGPADGVLPAEGRAGASAGARDPGEQFMGEPGPVHPEQDLLSAPPGQLRYRASEDNDVHARVVGRDVARIQPGGELLALSRCWVRDCLMVRRAWWPAVRACVQAVVGRPAVPVLWSQLTKRLVIATR